MRLGGKFNLKVELMEVACVLPNNG